MSNIIIRKVKTLDFPNFEGLCSQDDGYFPLVSSTESILTQYKEFRDNCFVAYDGSALIGYIYGGILGDTLYPQFMFVKESYRKCGLGRKLMEVLEIKSKCSQSVIFYRKSLREHYEHQDFIIGDELEVAIKNINGTL